MPDEDNEDSADINITVPSGSLTVTGYPAKILLEASATAVQSLSTATEIASSTGHDEIATTGKALQGSMQNVYNITESNVTVINFQSINIIEQKTITVIENQIENYTAALDAASVPYLDCKDAYDKCLRNAADEGKQVHCKALYTACLADRGASTLAKLLNPFS